ncbi:unnamed protein product [Spirodela intermedia]|uniref:Uncharacterized protein n=1 Tax=Spirodela intermedia TaxID=51605 RepID=A0A7I8KR04_SPIIN|nr:unnamed protein product [Spirodela intermedia]
MLLLPVFFISHLLCIDYLENSSVKTQKIAKVGHPLLSSVNKSTSHIRKPPHRRSSSPLNWFPRKKTDSFLKRKIQLLQEMEGMNSSLDETLGSANPHYTRIAREKIAAQEAAKKAMKARKAAMIEASWCRILHASRIHSKEAEVKLEKAEKDVAEALEAAAAMGVMMYDRPDCPRRSCEIETSSVIGGVSTHTVTASFETAFEVDKEVAAAVKHAFIRLANCSSSSNKDEFRELIHKISENPDETETDQSSEAPLKHKLEPIADPEDLGFNGAMSKPESISKQASRQRLSPSDSLKHSGSPQNLVDMMFNRLKYLSEDEIASLAVIVATCGLNAALLKMENSKTSEENFQEQIPLPRDQAKRCCSSVSNFMDGYIKRKKPEAELPSLDKFLVKHVSRLEKEVQEAKMSKKTAEVAKNQIPETGLTHPDLGSILVKHVSRLERDIQSFKNSSKNNSLVGNGEGQKISGQPRAELDEKENVDMNRVERERIGTLEGDEADVTHRSSLRAKNISSEGLDKVLVKHITRPEREKIASLAKEEGVSTARRREQPELCTESLDQILVDHRSELETVDMGALQGRSLHGVEVNGIKDQQQEIPSESLDQILTKHQSMLDNTKLQAAADIEETRTKGLDQILVKHQSKLEKAKLAAKQDWSFPTMIKSNRDHNSEVGPSLDQILVKHQSKVEKAKLAADQDWSFPTMTKSNKDQNSEVGPSLDQTLVKHQFKNENAKSSTIQKSPDQVKPVNTWRKVRDQKLQEAWGGLSLGNSLKPHLSRLEREKAAWKRAEEEELRRARAL